MNDSVEDYLRLLGERVSGARAYFFAKEIAAYHRIQASPGYREAALSCTHILRKADVPCSTIAYAADLDTHYFTQQLFKEWSCTGATLDIVYPSCERLSDFTLDDMSVIQRSGACDVAEAEIVYLADGFVPNRSSIDVTGKVIFIENGFSDITDWAAENGAIGILTVSMPETKPVRTEMYKDEQINSKCANLSFHLYRHEQENKLFGFALTPKKGHELTVLCKKLAESGDAPRVKAHVLSSLYDGHIENVQADIDGETDEEILITAHLCHPKSSVNDNASGVACAMEAISAINELIEAGELPKPRRHIRMLLIPEFTGTYAYLAANENRLADIKAGINLDMVGAYQDKTAGPLLVIATPYAVHSFAEDLSAILLEGLSKECPLPTKGQYTAMFSSAVKPFMTGSDHYILSDPTVGIPSVAVTQWPDKGYHTSMDSLDRLDPDMLCRVAEFTGAYVLTLANLSEENAEEILLRTHERFLLMLDKLSRSDGAERFAPHAMEFVNATLDSFLEYLPDSKKMQEKIHREKEYFTAFAKLAFGFVPKSMHTVGKVPRRLFKAPLSEKSFLAGLSAAEKETFDSIKKKYPNCKGLMDMLLYGVNGRDDIETIAEKTTWESGISCMEYAKEMISFLCEKGLVAMLS